MLVSVQALLLQQSTITCDGYSVALLLPAVQKKTYFQAEGEHTDTESVQVEESVLCNACWMQ